MFWRYFPLTINCEVAIMIKNFSLSCFTLIFLLFFSANVGAVPINTSSSQPMKIAILPIINSSSEYPKVNRYIYKQLQQAIHIPLNGVLGKIALTDTNDINQKIQALNINFDGLDAKNNMHAIAQSLDSNLIICVRILRMHQYINYAPVNIGEAIIHSNVYLQLSIYDRKTNTYKSYRQSAYYNDSYSPQGTVQSLTSDVLYNLLRKAQLKQYI